MRTKYGYWTILFLSVLCLLEYPQPALAAVGRTASSLNVSSSGEAGYSIPIFAPPGTNGMTPRLAFVYGHRNGGTLLGAGWSIAGLSAIARCPRIWAADSESRDVRNDASDRFCLDGNKLRVMPGSTYGQPGAIYQTEIETFARTTSYGTAGNGPQYFVVEGKDGLIYEYGNSTDSRIESVGQSTVRVWALNQVRDRSGNAIHFTYDEDTTNGAYRVDLVQYASNSLQGASAAYNVDFVWELKPSNDIDSGYVAGSVVKNIRRLDRVDVSHGGTLVRRYELAYEGALSSTSRSRLASIQECAGSPLDCLQPTSFTYQDGTPGLGAAAASASIPTTPWPLDVNGDGRDDLVYSSHPTSGSGQWMVMLADAVGGYGSSIPGPANTNYADAIPIDYNADGLEDVLVPYSGSTWWVMLGTSSGLGAPTDTGAPVTATGKGSNARAMDINGDGLDDLVWADIVNIATGGSAIRYRARVWGGAFSPTDTVLVGPLAVDSAISSNVFGAAGQRSRLRDPDFNGDGRGDFIYRFTTRAWEEEQQRYITNPGVSVFCVGAWQISAEWLAGSNGWFFGDFNADGKTDIVYSGVTNVLMRLSTGTSLIAGGVVPVSGVVRAVLDWDGDGYDDVLARTSAGAWAVTRATGEGFQSAVATGLTAGDANFTVADINGDGLTDLGNTVSGTWSHRLHSGSYPDLLQTATDGYGNAVTFAYEGNEGAGFGLLAI